MAKNQKPNSHPSRGMPLKVGLLCLGLVLLTWGGSFLALVILGQQQTGSIDYSVRRYGASRGAIYAVHYTFRVPGKGLYSGSASTGANYAPAGRLRIRYLGFWPGISHPGSDALLLFYAAVFLLPGTMLAGLSARTLHSARGLRRRST
jgi:hypothetical protein